MTLNHMVGVDRTSSQSLPIMRRLVAGVFDL